MSCSHNDLTWLFMCYYVGHYYGMCAARRDVHGVNYFYIKNSFHKMNTEFISTNGCVTVVKCFQITRRYAEFSGAVMVLHEKFPLEGVDGLMLQLQDEVEKVILKMAAVFHNRKDQLIFLINNYDMMLSVLSVSQ